MHVGTMSVLGAWLSLAPTASTEPSSQDVQVNVHSARATVQNLRKASIGEANAAHRYDLFAQKADEEGYPQVAKLFRAAAVAERIHRRNHEAVLRSMGQEPPQVQPEEVHVGSTRENLLVPIEGEKDEATAMYPRFAQQAKKDDVPAAALSFEYAGKAEQGHLRLFQKALRGLGHNPSEDYEVNTESGIVSSEPGGQAMPVTVAARKHKQTPRASRKHQNTNR